MDFAQSLYYSPMHGRFTSPDEFKGGPDELFDFEEDAADNPTFYADLSNPQSLNKYQYGYNNPYKYNDPSGHCPPCLAWAVFEVVSAAADVVVAIQTVRDPNASRGEKIVTVLGAAASITLPGGGYGIGAKVVIKALRREATETVVKKTAPAVAKNTVTKAPRIPKSERVGPVPKKLRKQKFDENRQANKGKLKCDYCGSDMAPAKKSQKGVTPPKNEATLDHVVPRSRGGSNNPPNLKPACRKCNGEKSDND